MKLTLRFQTNIGPRVGVLEVSDEITAKAILNSHLGQNGEPDDEIPCGALRDEMPRLSLSNHLAKHRKSREKAALKIIASDPKIAAFRKRVPKS